MVLKNNIYAHSFPNNIEKMFVVDTRENPHGEPFAVVLRQKSFLVICDRADIDRFIYKSICIIIYFIL